MKDLHVSQLLYFSRGFCERSWNPFERRLKVDQSQQVIPNSSVNRTVPTLGFCTWEADGKSRQTTTSIAVRAAPFLQSQMRAKSTFVGKTITCLQFPWMLSGV